MKGRVIGVRPINDIARVFLRARNGIVRADEVVGRGRRDPLSPVGREYISGVRDALAFVLDVDLRQMDVPKGLAGEIEPPQRVQVSWIDAYDCWLVEFPPDEMQARQQYRAEFLSKRQAFELLDALRDQVLGKLMLTPGDYAARECADAAMRAGMRPVAPVQLNAVRVNGVRGRRSPTSGDDGSGEGDLPQGA